MLDVKHTVLQNTESVSSLGAQSSWLVTCWDLPLLFVWGSGKILGLDQCLVSLAQECVPRNCHMCSFSQLPPVKRSIRGPEKFLFCCPASRSSCTGSFYKSPAFKNVQGSQVDFKKKFVHQGKKKINQLLHVCLYLKDLNSPQFSNE